jgi:PAS domain S-box-containing protein/putative nucleotidyltransferase with HDIG domain
MAFYKARMNKKLRDREEWLSTVLRSIGDGVIATDGAGRVTFMNALAEKLTGWPQEEALGRPLSEVFPCGGAGPDPASATQPLIEAALATRGSRTRAVEYTVSPIGGAEDLAQGSVLVFRDISSRKRAEEELKQSWERLQKALAGTVQAMALTIEMRDPYTAGHQRRVSKLSCAIAQELGLAPPQIEGLRTAGDIHDIGKIYVPAEILSKPGRLTEIETSIIRAHAQVGFDILKNVEFPWPIAQIIYQHHERLDGSGYPNKIRGDQILLEARIIAVADVIEAMSSHRPYRPSYGLDKALDEIQKHAGRLYDPAIVEVCVRLFEQNRFVFE